MIRKQHLAIAALGLLSVGQLLVCAPAEARRGANTWVQQNYEFDRPMHGYQGKAGNRECSYQRHPKRVCKPDGRGGESCQIVGWTLMQYCY